MCAVNEEVARQRISEALQVLVETLRARVCTIPQVHAIGLTVYEGVHMYRGAYRAVLGTMREDAAYFDFCYLANALETAAMCARGYRVCARTR
jgi:predicted RNase H-like HicB family nuclease